MSSKLIDGNLEVKLKASLTIYASFFESSTPAKNTFYFSAEAGQNTHTMK